MFLIDSMVFKHFQKENFSFSGSFNFEIFFMFWHSWFPSYIEKVHGPIVSTLHKKDPLLCK